MPKRSRLKRTEGIRIYKGKRKLPKLGMNHFYSFNDMFNSAVYYNERGEYGSVSKKDINRLRDVYAYVNAETGGYKDEDMPLLTKDHIKSVIKMMSSGSYFVVTHHDETLKQKDFDRVSDIVNHLKIKIGVY